MNLIYQIINGEYNFDIKIITTIEKILDVEFKK